MRFTVAVLALCALAIWYFRVPDAFLPNQEMTPSLIAGPSKLQTEFGPTLTGEALDAYRVWSREAAHFGAFAATDFGDYGWVYEYNSIEAAEVGALAYCGVPDCRVFARSFPLNRAGENELLVSQPTADAFAEFLTLPTARAFAVHGNGAGGSWINAGSLASAIAGALKECDRNSRDVDSDVPLSEGIEGCRVVYAER